MRKSLVKLAKIVHGAQRQLRRRHRIARVTNLLSKKKLPDTSRPEREFDSLRKRYLRTSKYGYDLSSLFERAATRALNIHRIANAGDRRLRILEIGCGDGMLCSLLAASGHNVKLCDWADWRIGTARNLDFVAADCTIGIPFCTGEFDFVCSFNSFEHFSDPRIVFDECVRITKPGGLMHFDFGPLYCSPYGLHAWSLMVPYSQFLFSKSFIESKFEQFGIWDLGGKRTELQSVNKWKPSQYLEMWSGYGHELVSCHRYNNEDHLDLIYKFPESFRGRELTYEDVTCAQLSVAIRKI